MYWVLGLASVADAAADAAASASGGMRAGAAAGLAAGIAAAGLAAGPGRGADHAAEHVRAAADSFAHAGGDAVDPFANIVHPVVAARAAASAAVTALIHQGILLPSRNGPRGEKGRFIHSICCGMKTGYRG